MNKDDRFYRDRQRYIAVTVIGPSTLRNQGSRGVIKAAQNHLGVFDLEVFRAEDEASFRQALDSETEKLRLAFPQQARKSWGAARKALNLFLRDICYNRFLCHTSGLSKTEDWMEIPLDSVVAAALKRKAGTQLPPWPGLNRLDPEISLKFQKFARQVASDNGISRVHLDMRLWLKGR